MDLLPSERRPVRVSLDPNIAELGRRIRARRKAMGLSQEKLALIAETDRAYVGRVERGTQNISFSVLCRLCAVLRCDVAALTVGVPKLTAAPVLER